MTNDLDDHRIISLSDDGGSLVTVSGDVSSAIWIGPRDGSARPRRQTWAKLDGFRGLCFSPDGRLVYTTEDGGRWSLWTMTPDGGERAPLLTRHRARPSSAWRFLGRATCSSACARAPGSRSGSLAPTAPTEGVAVRDVSNDSISVARDGTLVYGSLVGGAPRLFRLDAVGASPVPVTGGSGFGSSIEPLGQRIAFYSLDEAGRFRVDVVPREGGDPIWSAPADPPNATSRLILREDGLFLNTIPGDRTNVWQLPLDGSAPRRITNFDDQNLFDFAFSDDGRTLAVARGPRVRDAVLVKGFPGSPTGVSG